VTALTREQLASGPTGTTVLSQGFDQNTPLWFYILKEAEETEGGARVGAVGSRIVMETFHGLLEGSWHSILKEPAWKPTLGNGAQFTMNELLTLVNDVNPLG
jgi:hypothetical protein